MAIRANKLSRGFGNGTFTGSIAARVTQGFYPGSDVSLVEIIRLSAPGVAEFRLSAPGVATVNLKSSYK